MSAAEADEWSDADDSFLAKLPLDLDGDDSKRVAALDQIVTVPAEDETKCTNVRGSRSDLAEQSKSDSGPMTDADDPVLGQDPVQALIRSQYLCVTDLTQQLWCEQHLVYTLLGIEPQPPEPLEGEGQVPVLLKTADRPEVKAGKSVHLARELEVHDVVNVKITSRADKWALHILNLLTAVCGFLSGVPLAREVPIFGDPFATGDLFFGIIDELRFSEDDYSIHLCELKTRRSPTLPGKAQRMQHSFQVQLYKQLWDNLVRGNFSPDLFLTKLSLQHNADQPLSEEIMHHVDRSLESAKTLRQLLTDTLTTAQALVCINSVSIEYVHQNTGTHIGQTEIEPDTNWLERTFHSCMGFWRGERGVEGVSIEEAWKCHSCEYATICEWRLQKDRQYQQKNTRVCR